MPWCLRKTDAIRWNHRARRKGSGEKSGRKKEDAKKRSLTTRKNQTRRTRKKIKDGDKDKKEEAVTVTIDWKISTKKSWIAH